MRLLWQLSIIDGVAAPAQHLSRRVVHAKPQVTTANQDFAETVTALEAGWTNGGVGKREIKLPTAHKKTRQAIVASI
jgi:hypothetical protein